LLAEGMIKEEDVYYVTITSILPSAYALSVNVDYYYGPSWLSFNIPSSG
jgi:hypothetical protein